VSDAPETVSAARFTRSGVLAAPVLLTQERCRVAAIRAVVANSGNANAATGRRGLEDAARMQGAGAMVAGVREDQVAVASTGVIGVHLDTDKVIRGISDARRELSPEGDDLFGEAIRTTDRFAKSAALEVRLPSGTVRLCAQAKGAGMISPAFATMLCFVETDAALEPETADLLLGVCVKRSFDRISVDGQLSTNDTAILMASGAGEVRVAPESEDELRFGEALDMLLRRLALQMVRDGEGAKRVARVVVHGGHEPTVVRAARAPTRRSSSRPCTAATQTGAGSRRRSGPRFTTARRWRSTSGSRTSTCAARGRRRRTTSGPLPARCPATRSSTRSASPARVPRPRCSSPTSRTTT
jgi:glutamate N-acetyltransferase/amino-acid N-acetyltransferase